MVINRQGEGRDFMKLSSSQQKVVEVLSGRKLLPYGHRVDLQGWITTRLFHPLTIRSLIRRGIVEVSSDVGYMLRDNLDDLSVRLARCSTCKGRGWYLGYNSGNQKTGCGTCGGTGVANG